MAAFTLSQTAEKEFLRFKKVTSDGRPVAADPSDLSTSCSWTSEPTGSCPTAGACCRPSSPAPRGNACLTCDKFATDATHQPELAAQLDATQRLVRQRQDAFRARFGTEMSEDVSADFLYRHPTLRTKITNMRSSTIPVAEPRPEADAADSTSAAVRALSARLKELSPGAQPSNGGAELSREPVRR